MTVAAPVDYLRVRVWRYDELRRAGFPVKEATEIAEDEAVDLHEACALLAQGATVDEALRILR